MSQPDQPVGTVVPATFDPNAVTIFLDKQKERLRINNSRVDRIRDNLFQNVDISRAVYKKWKALKALGDKLTFVDDKKDRFQEQADHISERYGTTKNEMVYIEPASGEIRLPAALAQEWVIGEEALAVVQTVYGDLSKVRELQLDQRFLDALKSQELETYKLQQQKKDEASKH